MYTNQMCFGGEEIKSIQEPKHDVQYNKGTLFAIIKPKRQKKIKDHFINNITVIFLKIYR